MEVGVLPALEVVVDEPVPVPDFLYTERRFPAPHISFELPAHAKLQSAAAATAEPAPNELPQ